MEEEKETFLPITKFETKHSNMHRETNFQRSLLSEFYTLFTLMGDYDDKAAFWKNHVLGP